MINLQIETAFVEELIKIAKEKEHRQSTFASVDPEGMPVPSRPGKRFFAHYIGDPLLISIGTTAGAGLGQLAAQKFLKIKPKTPHGEKFYNASKMVIPAIAGMGAGLGTGVLTNMRKKRLIDAIQKDEIERAEKRKAAKS